jgi:hypothetical protein
VVRREQSRRNRRGSLGFIPSGVALTIRSMSASLRAHCGLVPWHRFEPRDRT